MNSNQQTLALLIMLAQSALSLQQGHMKSVEDTFENINKRIETKLIPSAKPISHN